MPNNFLPKLEKIDSYMSKTFLVSSFKEFLDSVKDFFSQLFILSKKVFDIISKFLLGAEI